MPIAILEIPKKSQIRTSKAQELCVKAGDIAHSALRVPNPEDKETRVTEGISNKPILRISFTIGPNEYPEFKQKSFFPTEEQINSAGQSILKITKDSPISVSQVSIEAWKDTTFLLRKGETPEPALPVSKEELVKIGSNLGEPRIKLVLSPQKREGGSVSKELGHVPENENPRVTTELSKRIAEIFGYESPIKAETEFAKAADAEVSVEFDCGIDRGHAIPENVRKYMAESVLHVLDSSPLTKEGTGEVWIRQGQPHTKTYN